MTVDVQHIAGELRADPSRVILRLFLPTQDMREGHSRVGDIVQRVVALPAPEVAEAAARIRECCVGRSDDFLAVLREHAHTVSFHAEDAGTLTDDQAIVLGAAFTAEYAVEGAALCNPSAMPHPDQSGLQPGQLRAAVSLRCIGEGHRSSIGFATAVVGPGPTWEFDPRPTPLVTAEVTEARWESHHFRRALTQQHRLSELTHAVISSLPEYVGSAELEVAIRGLPVDLAHHPYAARDIENLRTMMASAYEAEFPPDSVLGQRTLIPVAPEESSGMEDARFALFTYPDGSQGYRGTYTAYAGQRIAPRLIVSTDLVRFDIHRMTGDAARNKGIALFPRHVGGEFLAVTRTDGESMYLAHSEDGTRWAGAEPLQSPRHLWEIVQVGNCGSPIETERGWLLLTHGVGPMRRYSIGALLLDLDHPARVIGHLDEPLLEPDGDLKDGYVPHVVYSCGGIVHEGRLWVPYGVGDNRVRVASFGLESLLDSMSPAGAT